MGDSLQLRGFKPGGTEGQVPVKGAGGDFDWEWESVSGVGGGVTTFAELTDKATANIPAINSYVAPKASPTFTGTVTIPTGALISGYLTSAAAALAYQPLSAILTATDASFTTTIASRLENTSGTNTGDQTYTTLIGGAANYVPMDITPTSIPTTEGTLSWNADDHTLNIQTDIAGTVIQAGLESLTRVRNVSGSPITNGSVVYINGSSGQRPTVALAISTNDTHALSTIGLATADIAHNAFGFITIIGLVRGIDTTGIVEGTPLYLSASTAGAVTATPPTTNRIRVGWVAVESNNGTVLVGVEKQSVKSSEVSDATDANTANMIVKRDASGRASLELYNSTISGTVAFSGTGQASMFYALGTGTPSSTTYLRGDGTWATVAAGGVTGTGAVDNAILRSDGVGGTTLQNSDITISDASVTTQANVAIVNAHSGQTNSTLVLTPKGTGAFIVGPRPDGTTTGGTARGAGAVDLQMTRYANTLVASGANSFLHGVSSTASSQDAIAMGNQASATGLAAVAIGSSNTASGRSSFAKGGSNTASASNSEVGGIKAVADKISTLVFSAGGFGGTAGTSQIVSAPCGVRTTDAVPTELRRTAASSGEGGGDLNNVNAQYLTVTSGKVFSFIANITGIKADGSAVAMYVRKGAIKNVGGNTTLVGAIETIGTDIKDNALTDVAITANNTSDYLSIKVTGIAAETWRWTADVSGVEIAYGS